MQPTKFKLVLIGDAGVGKTTFIHQELTGEFVNEYHPTKKYERRVVPFAISNQPHNVEFDVWDIPGGYGRPSTRAKYLSDADAAIIMFDLSQRSTFDSVVHWRRELMIATEKPTPFVIFGAKEDIHGSDREINPKSMTWPEEMGQVEYFQGSRKTKSGDLGAPFLSLLRQLYKDDKLEFMTHGCNLVGTESPVLEGEMAKLHEEYKKEMIVCAMAPLPDEDDDL